MNRRLTAIAALSLACLLACSASPEEQITQVLEKRRQGLQNKDLNLYMSTVSPDYDDGENTYASIKQRTAGYFSTFEEIKLDVQNRSIYVTDDEARVVEKYILAFSLPTGKRMGRGEQVLILRREKDGWKIISGLGKQ
jgi:ketosteroid isomerase-like protein